VVKKKVLFLCTGNSCRSQMAEGLLGHINPDQYEVFSAGLKPSVVHPKAIRIMQEIGIDISEQCSKSVGEFAEDSFDIVVTVCDYAKESCPAFGGDVQRIHWSIPDPAGVIGDEEKLLESFRAVRDQIKERIEGEFGRD
jgi:arsenate reductase